MKSKQKNEKIIAGAVLLLVWVVFSAVNLIHLISQRSVLIEELQNKTDFAGVVEEIDSFSQEELLLRYSMIESHGLIQRLLGKKENANFDVVMDKSGQLHKGNFFSGFGDDPREMAINFRKLLHYAQTYGSQTGVVITPMKVAPEALRYSGIPYDNFHRIADSLLAWLRHYNVPSLDMRGIIQENGLTYETSFFKTDHHWTSAAAFAGYCEILQWMNETFDLSLDPDGQTRNLRNYDKVLYPEMMLGSIGRRCATLYGGKPEDFEVFIPQESGNYRVVFDKERDRTGSFQEVLVTLDLENEIQDIFKYSCYDECFLDGLHDLTEITNETMSSGPRVLMLCDSYSTPLGGFLAQNFRQLDMIYILGDHMDDALDMIRENKYDYVFACIYPTNLSVENLRLFEDLSYD